MALGNGTVHRKTAIVGHSSTVYNRIIIIVIIIVVICGAARRVELVLLSQHVCYLNGRRCETNSQLLRADKELNAAPISLRV